MGQARTTVVIIRLRDRDEVGSTFIRVLDRFVRELQAQENILMLVGLNERVLEQLDKTDLLKEIGEENVFMAEPQFAASLNKALVAANQWLEQRSR